MTMITMILGCLVTTFLITTLILFRMAGKMREAVTNTEMIARDMTKIEVSVRAEIAGNRGEITSSLKGFGDTISSQLIGLTGLNEQKLDNIRKTVEDRLTLIQDDNSKKLEQIRETVGEKLHDTLEKRLGESFKLVCDRLDQVHRGLGEMHTLAIGVGDLKKVLSNVRTRGTLGEVQLGNILEQILTPEQYATKVATKPRSRENVEYAIKLPGQDDNIVWLPIDAKFPTEDYQRLIDAQEKGDLELIKECGDALETRIKQQAKDIRDKYINPPNTTDFGILFLPFEGLYAEVLRRPGLYELLSRQYKIAVTGPTTIAALLNSLQMGFRTLAIQKRAGEVWGLLSAVKTEFSKFAEIFEKAHDQIMAAGNTLEDAASKSRNIERRLNKVQVLPAQEAAVVLEAAEETVDEATQEASS